MEAKGDLELNGTDVTLNQEINFSNIGQLVFKPSNNQTFTVNKNLSSSSNYSIDGSNDPTLTLYKGYTYTFDMVGNGHPFYLKSTASTSGTNNEYTSGVVRNGSSNSGSNGDSLVFTVPDDAPDTLWYQCSAHAGMLGVLNIGDSFTKIKNQKISIEKVSEDKSFSVNKSFPIPPSLKNIFKELFDDLGIQPPNTGCLERWSNQGVLLLNTYLTVERGKPGSHRNIGWERFTDYVLSKLNENKKNIVYLLWGKHAQEKAKIINSANNKIIMSAHPSPYSANYGFFGSRPFSKANNFLMNTNQTKINW